TVRRSHLACSSYGNQAGVPPATSVRARTVRKRFGSFAVAIDTWTALGALIPKPLRSLSWVRSTGSVPVAPAGHHVVDPSPSTASAASCPAAAEVALAAAVRARSTAGVRAAAWASVAGTARAAASSAPIIARRFTGHTLTDQ